MWFILVSDTRQSDPVWIGPLLTSVTSAVRLGLLATPKWWEKKHGKEVHSHLPAAACSDRLAILFVI